MIPFKYIFITRAVAIILLGASTPVMASDFLDEAYDRVKKAYASKEWKELLGVGA